jgi:kynurenine formamidase
MTGGSVDALLGTLESARVYDLEQPRYAGAPTFAAHEPGFVYSLHRRHEAGLDEARTSASGIIVTVEHSGTHIDALCHQAENMEMFGGRRVDAAVQTSTGFSELGVETIPPIIARGVLLDVTRQRGVERVPPGDTIGADELMGTAEAQGTVPGEGDVALVRTGNGAHWPERDDYEHGAGIGADASRWVAERRVMAAGTDNLAWDTPGDVDPEVGSLPGHVILIVRNGVYIIENLLLEELAADERYEFVFVCLPLKMKGGTGSPVRPVAIAPA